MIRLAPAQQVTVELSSAPSAQDLDNFEIWSCVRPPAEAAAPDPQAEKLLVTGRHPMLTPPRVVRLVHAVRRPLADPAGPLTPQRQPGETFVRLLPPADRPLLGIDPASTIQLDVAATWTEPVDDKPRTVNAAVQSVPVGVTDTHLPQLRHELGDTRHRQVTYRLRAVSRFRQFFHQDEPATAFVAETRWR